MMPVGVPVGTGLMALFGKQKRKAPTSKIGAFGWAGGIRTHE